jgi:Sulfatase
VRGRCRQLLLALLLVWTAGVASSCSDDEPPDRAERHPPIVMLVFDEFSTVSLLDADGGVDATRYPNFAALGRDATWFPYATASLDETGRAIRSLFTGRTLWRYAKPSYAESPDNLFTLLGRRYRMNASEETSSLCPRRLCPNVRRQGKQSILRELRGGRPQRLTRWLRSVRPAKRPTFYFKHVLLPHGPWVYLPSGRRYGDGARDAGFSWELEHSNRWLVDQSYQRHLLQVGFTDRLLGRALERLRATGLYDRSLIVVTADNGESFGRIGNGHEINRRNAADIALTPLFVKLPFQERGRVDRRHVRTIDVLPTIARVAHLRPRWPVEGRSVFGPGARRIPSSTLLVERSGRTIRLSLGELRRRASTALRLKLGLFGSGDDPPGLFGLGPYGSMHGTPVARWPRVARSATRAIVDPVGRGTVPVKVSGRLSGSGSHRPTDLAIALNGTIVATAPTITPSPHARQAFTALVPESSLGERANRLEVFAIERREDGERLRPLGP